MKGFRYLVAISFVAAAACGNGNPSAPSEQSPGGGLPFQATRYNLSFIASQCGSGSQLAASVFLQVTMKPEVAVWVAVPERPNGTLSVRFQQAAAPPSTNLIAVGGSASGFADDEGSTGTGSGTRVNIATAVPLSGLLLFSDVANGTLDGPVTFIRNDGTTVTCPAGATRWFLNRFSFSQRNP